MHVNSGGNTVAKISSTFSNSTTTGLYIDTAGDSSEARLLFSKSGTTRGLIKYVHNATANSEAITFGTAGGSERMRITGSGVVGIGTSSPVGILHLQSDDNGVVFQSSSSTNSRAQIFFQNNGGTQRAKIAVDPDGGNANVMAFSTGTTERMRIDSSGNVGIGTTSPTANCKLHVVDADAQIELEGTSGSNSGFIDFDGTNLQLSTNRNMKSGTFSNTGKSNASILLLGPSGGSTIRFYTASADNTTASERMRITSEGVVQFDNGISEEYIAVTSSSNATTVNLQDGTNFSHTLTENTTFTFSNPAASGKVSAFTLKLVQDSSASGYTVTWPSSVDWPSATAPTLTATASAVDYFVFITHDGGTTYYGFTAGQALG